VHDIKPQVSYNNMYQNHTGSAVLAALNNPQPPPLLPVGALVSQLNAPVGNNNQYRSSQDILYSKTLTMDRDHNSLSKNNPNLASLMNFKMDTSISTAHSPKSMSLPVKTESLASSYEHDQSNYTVHKMENAMPYNGIDQSMTFKQEPIDQSMLMKSTHDLFEPSAPKAIPVTNENDMGLPTTINDQDIASEITPLKPAAVSQS